MLVIGGMGATHLYRKPTFPPNSVPVALASDVCFVVDES